jgi:hypothetical protein
MLNVGWYCLSRRVLVSPFCYGLSAPPLPLFDPSTWSQTIGQVVVRLSMLCWYVGYCRLVCQGPCGSFWSCRRVFVFYLSRVLLNNLCESLWTPNPYESSRFFKYPVCRSLHITYASPSLYGYVAVVSVRSCCVPFFWFPVLTIIQTPNLVQVSTKVPTE